MLVVGLCAAVSASAAERLNVADDGSIMPAKSSLLTMLEVTPWSKGYGSSFNQGKVPKIYQILDLTDEQSGEVKRLCIAARDEMKACYRECFKEHMVVRYRNGKRTDGKTRVQAMAERQMASRRYNKTREQITARYTVSLRDVLTARQRRSVSAIEDAIAEWRETNDRIKAAVSPERAGGERLDNNNLHHPRHGNITAMHPQMKMNNERVEKKLSRLLTAKQRAKLARLSGKSGAYGDSNLVP
jgi:hypothetical protein